MSGRFRLILYTTIPTLAALIGFLWFRRKKKDPSIADGSSEKPELTVPVKVPSQKVDEKVEDEVEEEGEEEEEILKEEKEEPIVAETITMVTAAPQLTSAKVEQKENRPLSNGPLPNESDLQSDIEALIMPAESPQIQNEVPTKVIEELITKTPSTDVCNGPVTTKIEEVMSMSWAEMDDESNNNADIKSKEPEGKEPELKSKEPDIVSSHVHVPSKKEESSKKREGSLDSAISDPDSPAESVDSSEVSSDSGKGTSLVEEPTASASPSETPPNYCTYEFEFPTELCGRLIGKQGKNINVIKSKTGADIRLRRKHFVTNFQICCIEGSEKQVKAALEQIQKRFSTKQYPDITYEKINVAPVLPPIMQMSLPEGVSVDVIVSSVVDANHLFVQQPTHPTFSSLERLNYLMNMCYTQEGCVPHLPTPIEVGVICVAPMYDGWFRAQVVATYEDCEEVDIKFVDYGGYLRISPDGLRQIRGDFTTLPFQAVECYLANVIPPKDMEAFPPEAAPMLEQMVHGKLLQAQIVAHEADGVPYIQIYEVGNNLATFVNRELVNQGLGQWIEMS